MTDSRFTFTRLSGSFELRVELDEDAPEPAVATCQRAQDALVAMGIVPKDALVTGLAVSTPVAGVVRCSVEWKAPPPSQVTS